MIAWPHAVVAIVAVSTTATFAFPAPAPAFCAASAPREFAGRSAHWLGVCPGGRPEGAGVMRLGRGKPFAFFVGTMRAGRPVAGMLIDEQGLFKPAKAFDSRGEAISPDGEHPAEQDAVFALATRAAQETALRFTRAGNRDSAAYYQQLARHIRDGQPE